MSSVVILQVPGTAETRAVLTATMLSNDIRVLHCKFDSLEQVKAHLERGALPVGSVEFCRRAMAIAGIKEPVCLSYPAASQPYLHREIQVVPVGSLQGTVFVKPLTTKLFSGFVFNATQDPHTLGEYEREQHAALTALAPDELVWSSTLITWHSEWRYYVAHGEPIGQARYDDGPESAPEPDLNVVRSCIGDLGIGHPYALDMGVLASGETALVEINDAWALGLYGSALAPRSYMTFLRSRWNELLLAK